MFLTELLDELSEELNKKRAALLQEISDLEELPQTDQVQTRLRVCRGRLDNLERRLVEIGDLQLRIQERLPSAETEIADFKSLVEYLSQEEVRKEQGRTNELVKAATKSIKTKWSTELIAFGDADKDYPFLLPEAQV